MIITCVEDPFDVAPGWHVLVLGDEVGLALDVAAEPAGRGVAMIGGTRGEPVRPQDADADVDGAID